MCPPLNLFQISQDAKDSGSGTGSTFSSSRNSLSSLGFKKPLQKLNAAFYISRLGKSIVSHVYCLAKTLLNSVKNLELKIELYNLRIGELIILVIVSS